LRYSADFWLCVHKLYVEPQLSLTARAIRRDTPVREVLLVTAGIVTWLVRLIKRGEKDVSSVIALKRKYSVLARSHQGTESGGHCG
jgi:hypothetical protein